MLRSLSLAALLATASALTAQTSVQTSAQPAGAPPVTDQQPAPVVRAYASGPQDTPPPQSPDAAGPQDPNAPGQPPRGNYAPMPRRIRRPGLNNPASRPPQIVDSQPIAGVWLRSTSASSLKTIAATPQNTEVRLERGILNVNVHQPAQHAEILIDLPGGQTSLLKDGLYTFNANTNTVRVLHGEAAAYVDPHATDKHIKVKEGHQLSFSPAPPAPGSTAPSTAGFRPQSVEAYPYELAADLLPASPEDGSAYANASGPGYGGEDPWGYPPAPYYGGFYGYPYGYSGYPFGFYPYVGLGFGYGYYGGFHGYGGGFHGHPGFRR